jgi:hypothetical protein
MGCIVQINRCTTIAHSCACSSSSCGPIFQHGRLQILASQPIRPWYVPCHVHACAAVLDLHATCVNGGAGEPAGGWVVFMMKMWLLLSCPWCCLFVPNTAPAPPGGHPQPIDRQLLARAAAILLATDHESGFDEDCDEKCYARDDHDPDSGLLADEGPDEANDAGPVDAEQAVSRKSRARKFAPPRRPALSALAAAAPPLRSRQQRALAQPAQTQGPGQSNTLAAASHVPSPATDLVDDRPPEPSQPMARPPARPANAVRPPVRMDFAVNGDVAAVVVPLATAARPAVLGPPTAASKHAPDYHTTLSYPAGASTAAAVATSKPDRAREASAVASTAALASASRLPGSRFQRGGAAKSSLSSTAPAVPPVRPAAAFDKPPNANSKGTLSLLTDDDDDAVPAPLPHVAARRRTQSALAKLAASNWASGDEEDEDQDDVVAKVAALQGKHKGHQKKIQTHPTLSPSFVHARP